MASKLTSSSKGHKCGFRHKVKDRQTQGLVDEVDRKHRAWLARRGYSAKGMEFGAGSPVDLRQQISSQARAAAARQKRERAKAALARDEEDFPQAGG